MPGDARRVDGRSFQTQSPKTAKLRGGTVLQYRAVILYSEYEWIVFEYVLTAQPLNDTKTNVAETVTGK